MNSLVIRTVIDYMDSFLFEPDVDWPSYWFRRRVYSRWAICELIELIGDESLTPVSTIIERFIVDMWYFSHVNENRDSGAMFSIAAGTAEGILGYLHERRVLDE